METRLFRWHFGSRCWCVLTTFWRIMSHFFWASPKKLLVDSDIFGKASTCTSSRLQRSLARRTSFRDGDLLPKTNKETKHRKTSQLQAPHSPEISRSCAQDHLFPLEARVEWRRLTARWEENISETSSFI